MNYELNNNLGNGTIDIGSLFKLFLRNKKTIFSFGLIFFLLSSIFSFTMKKQWQGEFQIVLDIKENKLNSLNPALENLLNSRNSSKKSLNTEVGILKSPSVLNSIYKFVREEYLKSNPKGDGIKYSEWKKRLAIDLQKNTSILNISYKDFNKDIIIPVLNKLSKKYQDYSGRSKEREITLTKNYLKEQINIFNKKSSESIRLAQEFGIDQNLMISDLLLFKESDQTLSNIDFEEQRVKAANEIRKIEIQILQIENLGDDVKQIQYIGSTIPALVEEGLPELLGDLDIKLTKMRALYSEKDRSLQQIIQERDILIKLIKERTVGFLKARKSSLQAKMQAVIRPKEVLIKYKELIRKANRDEVTLIALENKLNAIKLEEAKSEDPWQLITDPTLNNTPVSISKKKVVFIGSILGIFLGFLFALLEERKSGIIFDEYYYEKIFNSPILQKDFDGNLTSLFLIDAIKNINTKEICIFTLNLFDNQKLQDLKNCIQKINNKISVNFKDDLSELNKKELLILFTSIGKLKFNQAFEIQKIKEKYNLEFSGIILDI